MRCEDTGPSSAPRSPRPGSGRSSEAEFERKTRAGRVPPTRVPGPRRRDRLPGKTRRRFGTKKERGTGRNSNAPHPVFGANPLGRRRTRNLGQRPNRRVCRPGRNRRDWVDLPSAWRCRDRRAERNDWQRRDRSARCGRRRTHRRVFGHRIHDGASVHQVSRVRLHATHGCEEIRPLLLQRSHQLFTRG